MGSPVLRQVEGWLRLCVRNFLNLSWCVRTKVTQVIFVLYDLYRHHFIYNGKAFKIKSNRSAKTFVGSDGWIGHEFLWSGFVFSSWSILEEQSQSAQVQVTFIDSLFLGSEKCTMIDRSWDTSQLALIQHISWNDVLFCSACFFKSRFYAR